uniref:Transmembrane protein putative n=1 Tax=Albugo laibachii Nc14 TaxID=890382 RepID=F0WU39_9STRA|nr:transmembrane protein putative [Albugo laibachii Nc14]|eukprot:CCA24884.1 transmembrane protein putative [Albugo laibachii Nc14]
MYRAGHPDKEFVGECNNANTSTVLYLILAMGRWDLHAVLQADLDIVRYFNGLLTKYTILRHIIFATTSRSRLRDTSFAIWIVFFLSVPSSGFPYLWLTVINAIGALLGQYMLSCRRPIDFVNTFYDTKRTDPDTFGFPCVDTHMSVVVLFPIITTASNIPLRLCALLLLLYVPVTRVMIASRFVSQIIGSILTGLLGSLLGQMLQLRLNSAPISSTLHQVGLVALLFFCVGILSFHIENNQSRILGIQKREFKQVFKDILQGDPVKEIPADSAKKAGKKDSFYHLVRSLRRNSLE